MFNNRTNMAILKDFAEKIKGSKEELFLIALICLSGLFGFGAGRVSKIIERKTPIVIKESVLPAVEAGNGASAEYFVASKNGKKYYFSWCDGAKRISVNNIVRFENREDAEAAGYEKAANCPGL